MSTTTLDHAAPAPQVSAPGGFHLPTIDSPISRIPFTRLVRVETRKQVDTLAGRWFLIAIAVIVAATITIMLFVNGGDHTFNEYLMATSMPLGILVPVLGILAATQEWSQRTAMTTFTLEPRRGRVVAAKIVSTLLLGLGAIVTAIALAAAGRFIAGLRGVESGWGLDWWIVGGMALLIILSMLQGVGFGLALLNTPAAIVAFFAIPMLLPLMYLVSWLRTPAEWLDMSSTTAPLMLGEAMTGEQWAHLAVSVAVWVGAPLVIGVWRVLRREVK